MVSLDSTQESGVPLNQHSSIRVKLRPNTTLSADHELPLRPASALSGSALTGVTRRSASSSIAWQPLIGALARLARTPLSR